MNVLFHLHSNHSYDCNISPEFIVKYAIKNGINIICITDHDTINGSKAAADYASRNNLNLHVIIGAEYYTNCGDIIGLFLKNEIIEKDALKLVEEIHRQGGLAVLPHPFKSHRLTDELLHMIDIVETFNARCSQHENNKALELAKKFGKPIMAGSDAHLKAELRLCYNKIGQLPIQAALLGEKQLNVAYTNNLNIIKSQLIKGYKTRNMALIISMFKSILSVMIIKPVRALLGKKPSKI